MHLVVDNLFLRLGKRQLLQQVNLSLGKGQVLGVLGATDSGKSLLVEVLAGLRRPTSGQVFLHGEPLPEGKRRLDKLGVVFARANFFAQLNIYRNLALTLTRRQRRKDGEDAITRVCERLRISHLLGTMPDDLNAWQLLQLQLARALLNEPEALVLDAPFEQVPAGHHNALRLLIAEEACQGNPVIFTCTTSRQAQLVADYIALLEGGRIVQQDSADGFLSMPADLFVANMFFDQGLGLLRGRITRRMKTTLDCLFVEEFPARLMCKPDKLIDYSSNEIILGVYASQVGFTPPEKPNQAFAIKARLLTSRQLLDSHFSLWRVDNRTIIESITRQAPPGSGMTELWVHSKDALMFDEHGKTLAVL